MTIAPTEIAGGASASCRRGAAVRAVGLRSPARFVCDILKVRSYEDLHQPSLTLQLHVSFGWHSHCGSGGTADALASGASWSNPVGVQIPASAPSTKLRSDGFWRHIRREFPIAAGDRQQRSVRPAFDSFWNSLAFLNGGHYSTAT